MNAQLALIKLVSVDRLTVHAGDIHELRVQTNRKEKGNLIEITSETVETTLHKDRPLNPRRVACV